MSSSGTDTEYGGVGVWGCGGVAGGVLRGWLHFVQSFTSVIVYLFTVLLFSYFLSTLGCLLSSPGLTLRMMISIATSTAT